jgi:hypothetical protein
MASSVIYDAASVWALPSPSLNVSYTFLRRGIQEPVRAEDKGSSEVGPGDSCSACTQSASPRPLVRVPLSSRKGALEECFLPELCPIHYSEFSAQLPSSSSSHSSIPGFISTSQKVSTINSTTPSSALTLTSTYPFPASISPTPISRSQTLNVLRCCGKTFRRPCDLRLPFSPNFSIHISY